MYRSWEENDLVLHDGSDTYFVDPRCCDTTEMAQCLYDNCNDTDITIGEEFASAENDECVDACFNECEESENAPTSDPNTFVATENFFSCKDIFGSL